MQKQVPPRLAAVHRDDERAFRRVAVVRIDVAGREEDPVLDGDRMQLAGAHGEEGKARRSARLAV